MEAPLRGPAPRPIRRDGSRTAPPPGSVAGDLSRQPFSFRAPRDFFVDAVRRCRRCGARFVLTGREQKRWTEALGLRLDARASRCASCRRKWLRRQGAAAALADAARALSEAPLHAPAALAYARAAVAIAQRLGEGPLESALAALGALSSVGEPPAEARYLAGRCHEAAGRGRAAAAAYRRFLAACGTGRDLAPLRRDARRRLAASAAP